VAESSSKQLALVSAILASSIAINLGSLGFFKYAQFFSNTAVDLLHVFGISFEPVSLGILLPVGISFYTFESLSYVIDVYRRRIDVSKSLLDYGLYVTFFPHLVAGPILRYGDFSPQCERAKSWQSVEVGKGLALFVYGLALKVCLADLVFAPVVDLCFRGSASSRRAHWRTIECESVPAGRRLRGRGRGRSARLAITPSRPRHYRALPCAAPRLRLRAGDRCDDRAPTGEPKRCQNPAGRCFWMRCRGASTTFSMPARAAAIASVPAR